MARIALVILALGAASPILAARGQAAVTPVQKVVTMLSDMLAKGKKEKMEEQDMFADYKRFCESTTAEKKAAIAKAMATVDKLTADIAKAEADIEVAQKAITVHDADIAGWDVKKNEETAERKQEHADYEVEYRDYTDSIEAVERAEASIGAGSEVSLIEQRAAIRRLAELGRAAPSAKGALAAFLQEGKLGMDMAAAAPEAKQYESHSGGVMDIVSQMGENFEEKRAEIEKEEMQKGFSFDRIVQDLTSSITDATRERDEKVSRAQAIGEEKGQNKLQLGQTESVLATETVFLSDLSSECAMKSDDYEKRQEVRAGEIEAIQNAIEIMSSAAISAGTQHLPSFAEEGTFLVQLRSSAVSPLQKNAAAFLSDRAQRSKSRLLSLVAARLREDPFKKVTKMIKDMITKLMGEAQEDTEHKGFCDHELATNKQTRDMKSGEAEELTARSDKFAADIQKLTAEIADLSDEIAVIDAEVQKATAEREVEKAKNAATIVDAKGGQAATQKALEVLRSFYATAAEASALAQMRAGAGLSKPYQGMGGTSSVLGMLEVVEADFARLDAETTAGEAEAEHVYSKFTQDSSREKATLATDLNARSAAKLASESSLADTKKDLKSTKEELAAAAEYFDKLKPSCVMGGTSYEERVAHRKEEVESLKEALLILNSENP